MSEQTPDTNNGVSDGQDPSMEDILASIRKIIAEDDVQPSEALDATVDTIEADPLGGDVSELAHADYLDLDIIEDEIAASDNADTLSLLSEPQAASDMTDIDTLIGDMDEHGVEDMATIAPEELPVSEAEPNDVLDLVIPMEDEEADMEDIAVATDEFTDLALDDELELLTSDIENSDVAALTGTTSAQPLQDDLSLMLDNMLEDSQLEQDSQGAASEELVIDASITDERVIGPAEDLLDEIDLTLEDNGAAEVLQEEASQTDPDIDLVKSLMADLTEEPLHDNLAEDHELISAIDIDDVETSDDIMDEILSMTLDDETKLSEEIAIPDINSEFLEGMPDDSPATEGLSLKEIAAAAEADAQAVGTGLPTGVMAGLGAAALGGIAATVAQDDPPVAEDIAPEADGVDDAISQLEDLLTDDMDSVEDQIPSKDLMPEEPVHISPEPLIEETPNMARAKKTEAIIDEVTEEATAGAFASLTNVVENKAVTAERGDRIGDLVMEALQPMLKEWLDANLKGIVERAVTKEVKRISSGK